MPYSLQTCSQYVECNCGLYDNRMHIVNLGTAYNHRRQIGLASQLRDSGDLLRQFDPFDPRSTATTAVEDGHAPDRPQRINAQPVSLQINDREEVFHSEPALTTSHRHSKHIVISDVPAIEVEDLPFVIPEHCNNPDGQPSTHLEQSVILDN